MQKLCRYLYNIIIYAVMYKTHISQHLAWNLWSSRCIIGEYKPLLARRKRCCVIHGRRRRCNPVTILYRRRWQVGPKQSFCFDASHDRSTLELFYLLSEVFEGFLGIIVWLKHHVPRCVVSKFARYNVRAVFSREEILKYINLKLQNNIIKACKIDC